jgi:molybdopterin-containing oxidoreductase family membrane subunit
MHHRMGGAFAPFFWTLIVCNVLLPQALWWRAVRRKLPLLFCIALGVHIGMWLERFVIVTTSLQKDYLPSAWHVYIPTGWDWGTLIGSLGLFFSLLFLFIRLLPAISMHEAGKEASDKEAE